MQKYYGRDEGLASGKKLKMKVQGKRIEIGIEIRRKRLKNASLNKGNNLFF